MGDSSEDRCAQVSAQDGSADSRGNRPADSLASPLDGPTCAPGQAFPAAGIAAAKARLTAGTDRYMRAAAHAVAAACVRELRLLPSTISAVPGDRGSGRAVPAGIRGSRVLALVGGGSNGADALLACALLARRGCAVTALLAGRRPVAAVVEEARASGVEVVDAAASSASSAEPAAPPPPAPVGLPGLSQSARAAVARLRRDGGAVIDGLTGTGGSGPLRPVAAALVGLLLADQQGPACPRGWRVVAVDVPSGTGVDDATLAGPVLPADCTVTFTCLKAALCLPPACHLVGRLEVVDLGLPVPAGRPLVRRPPQEVLARSLHVPGARDHKYTRGVVGLWAGSTTYPGAAVLAASGAVRAGAGMVRLSAPRRVEDLVLATRPEVVPAPGRCQALVIGPGTAAEDHPRAEQLRGALRRAAGGAGGGQGVPAVVDAGALALLPQLLEEGAGLAPQHVLTPHAGEAAALLTSLGRRRSRSQVEEAPLAAARSLSAATGATVVLKGAVTLVVVPGGTPVSVDGGPGWLATAGSGDVLAGVLGALLASAAARADLGQDGQGADLFCPDSLATVVAAGVRLHALAGLHASHRCASALERHDGTGHPAAALEVADALPAAWSRMTAGPAPAARAQ